MKATIVKIIVLFFLLMGSALPLSAGTLLTRNMRIEPEFICPGQAVTVYWEVSHPNDANATVQVQGAFSTNDAVWDNTNDNLFLYSGGEGLAALPAPIAPFTKLSWSDSGYAVNFLGWYQYSFGTVVPASYTPGSTATIIIDMMIGGANWINFVPAATVSLPIEVTCDKYALYNVANMDDHTASGRLVISRGCNSPTNTPTRTVTQTQTPTASITLTSTPSFTPSATATVTPSFSYTVTPTNTATKTSTITVTVAGTLTFSPTITLSATPTSSSSATPTLSFTPTVTATQTPSRTPTPTPSVSNTQTPGPSATDTSTPTATGTFTRTATYTATSSPTPSFTQTQTLTASPTRTMTVTNTSTLTVTETSTATSSETVTATPSMTFTRTPSFTASPSITPTPTITQTPFKAPFKVEIGVYNSAGEHVRLLFNGAAQTSGGSFTLSEGILLIGQSQVDVNFPGALLGTASVFWKGFNDAGQPVDGGQYYIKVEIVDTFGKVTSMIEAVQVLDSRQDTQLAVFNSAGEEVAKISVRPAVNVTDFSLTKSLVSPVYDEATGVVVNPVVIQLRQADGTMIARSWDGRTSGGQILSSGVYTLRMIRYTQAGKPQVTIRKLTLIQNASSRYSAKIFIAPNPVSALQGVSAHLSVFYKANPGREISVAVYNLAGELVISGKTSASSGRFDIDLGDTSAGVYFAEIRIHNGSAGILSREILKFAVLR